VKRSAVTSPGRAHGTTIGALVVSLALLASTAAVGADEAPGWTFNVAPYLWLSGVEGTTATVPPAAPADLDVSFGDLLDELDGALMGLAEARNGRLGLFGELFFVSIAADAATPGPFFSGADYDQDLWGLSLGGFYRAVNAASGSLDLLGGVRFWKLESELRLDPGRLSRRTVSTDEGWTDPIAGLKGRYLVSPRWYLTGWAVAAVAGDSDSAWDVFAGVGYVFGEAKSVVVGYRHQSLDFSSGPVLYDVETSGPLLGLSFRF
jgi:hypothetical protein